MTRPLWLGLCLAITLRLVATAVVTQLGFSAISDDDFARVVIAQSFAHQPVWDPTGSSWLPFPFWLTGAVLHAFGGTLSAARAFAWCTSALSVALYFAAARLIGLGRKWLLVTTCGYALLPHAVWLGAATVPEGYTAALCFFSLASVCRQKPWLRWGGVLAVSAAALSRYEAWPVAFVVASYNGMDALTYRRQIYTFNNKTHRDVWLRVSMGAGAVFALLGPIGWMVHGYLNHDDVLFFLKRVANYRRALGQSPRVWLEALTNYPLALITREPEAAGFVVVTLAVWARQRIGLSTATASGNPRSRSPRTIGLRPASHWRILTGVVAVLGFLVLGDLFDGAPTHHPERALLVCWLAALALTSAVLAACHPTRVELGVVCGVVAASGLLRLGQPSSTFVDRSSEVALGAALAPRLADDRRLFIETQGYGYLAVSAATSTPWRVVARNPTDPRQTDDVWASEASLRAFLVRERIGWLAVYEPRRALAAAVASPKSQLGDALLFRFGSDIRGGVENSEGRSE